MDQSPKPRYRFADFVVSPGRRLLLCSGKELALIPRYFDLLVLLLEKRHEAVHRREIMERVWSDVVVSDGALSQAVRTLRRTLGDDSREPVFIKTVSRHGYRFVFPDVHQEPDEAPLRLAVGSMNLSPEVTSALTAGVSHSPTLSQPTAFEAALERLLQPGGHSALDDDERREAAETLHVLGTDEALRRLDRRPGHAAARAILRDARWDVPGAGTVPLIGVPGGAAAISTLVLLRLRRAARLAGRRWAAASGGGAAAGACAGCLGGVALLSASEWVLPRSVPVALAMIGAVVGGLGAAGVGAGLAVAEALARSTRSIALVACGALGGGTIGATAHLLGRWTLEGMFGHDLSAVGGALEGIALGAAAGLGYALSTPRAQGGGMATPRGWSRLWTAMMTGACCAGAGVMLSLAGRNLVGSSLTLMARSFEGSQVDLRPIARLLGEHDLGPVTRMVVAVYESLFFGFGLALGITRRPQARF